MLIEQLYLFLFLSLALLYHLTALSPCVCVSALSRSQFYLILTKFGIDVWNLKQKTLSLGSKLNKQLPYLHPTLPETDTP